MGILPTKEKSVGHNLNFDQHYYQVPFSQGIFESGWNLISFGQS